MGSDSAYLDRGASHSEAGKLQFPVTNEEYRLPATESTFKAAFLHI